MLWDNQASLDIGSIIMFEDLETELSAGLLRCLGEELAPSAEAVQGMIHEAKTRPLLIWLARYDDVPKKIPLFA